MSARKKNEWHWHRVDRIDGEVEGSMSMNRGKCVGTSFHFPHPHGTSLLKPHESQNANELR